LERGTDETVISRAWEDANTIEYVIPPKGRISLTRRVKYELREHEHGTTVTVAAFAARGNLRFDLQRLAAVSRD
jgi:hypothetical protein